MNRTTCKCNPVVVELTGLPGAGKSTLAASITRVLEDRGVACAVRTDIGRYNGRPVDGLVAEAFPRVRRSITPTILRWYVHTILYGLSVRRPGSTRRVELRRFVRFVWALHHAVTRCDSDVWLLDGGVTQRLLAMGFAMKEAGKHSIHSVVKYTGRLVPFRVIHVDASAELAWERIQERQRRTGTSPFWSTPQAREVLPAAEATLRRVMRCVEMQGFLLARVSADATMAPTEATRLADIIQSVVLVPRQTKQPADGEPFGGRKATGRFRSRVG